MPSGLTYIDFVNRHSFGEVPLVVYDAFKSEGAGGIFRLAEPVIPTGPIEINAFCMPSDYWNKRKGSDLWNVIDNIKPAIVSGSFVKGVVTENENRRVIKASTIVPGNQIMSDSWSQAGIRHIDFVERAVPISEEHHGFEDYVLRWRERELRDQGIRKSEMHHEDYNNHFMRVQGPIRYHFFLAEEAQNEPDCYYKKGKVFPPYGIPVFEDLYAGKLDDMKDEYWGPIWTDPEYPRQNSIWMWITKKDNRFKCKLTVTHRGDKITLMLVPFYFSFVL